MLKKIEDDFKRGLFRHWKNCYLCIVNVVLQHIEFLLSTHPCVIVPGLGAFIASDKEAAYNFETGQYDAPGRQYAFNASLDVSDGLLVMSVARSMNVEYENAQKIVSDTVNEIKNELYREGEFSFGRIGRLEISENGTLRFVTFEDDFLTPFAGWLPSVDVNIFTRKLRKKKNIITVTPYSEQEHKSHRLRNFVRTAAGAVAAILIAIVVSTPITFKNSYTASTVPSVTAPRQAQAPMTPQKKIEKGNAEKTGQTPGAKKKLPDNSEINLKKSESVDKKDKKETKPIQKKEKNNVLPKPELKPKDNKEFKEQNVSEPLPRFNYDDSFIVVVASLATRDDAEKFILDYARKLDYPLGIEPAGDKYRIYAATAPSGGQAMREAQSPHITKHFKGAWVTTRAN